ncbi:lactate permease LctP family transporter [uncultured Paludibaculum sp.]|uniref:L-lactate permease n=1 Tax=uncultured Paludibaculum sp. TaxID=1765020 RepID=UPI002AAAA65B|nr:lactate permease LctP family transporter [uncultured Paludibaculum sp.]
MWQQHYTPVADSLGLSTLVAALPLFTLLYLLGVKRKAAWIASLWGLAAATLVSLAVYRMPVDLTFSAIAYGAAFGLFPICWIIFWAIFLYRLSVETGQFEIVKDSIGGLTQDRRLQALLIAFAFGAFVEGAAGFGAPVAVAAAMLTGLGFSPFYSAGICLLANTAPVAFGSIGIPVITLAGITGLPLAELSAAVGRICAPVSLFIPSYLVMVMGGWRALRGVLPATIACGVAFAGSQFYASNYLGPELTDILGSLAAIGSCILLTLVWKPKDHFTFDGAAAVTKLPPRHTFGAVVKAWSPYGLLVICVLLWGRPEIKAFLNTFTIPVDWPGLHNQVVQAPPVTAKALPYAAKFAFNWLSAAGSACLASCLLSLLVLRPSSATVSLAFRTTCSQLGKPVLTVASVLGLAFLMNYSGATGTLGLAFSATGAAFPFFSALLGWLGVFLTGSDTSANALFGNLQVVTANRLSLNPILMAASNSSGGVMGKMISLQSIAVAAAATGMPLEDESRLFRFTLRHSVLLASIIGLVVLFYAYVMPAWAPH